MLDLIPAVLIGGFLGGFTLGLTGFGNALTSYGIWLHVLSPQLAAPMVAFGSLLSHAMMFRGFRHAIQVRRFMPFVIGGALGVPVGTYLLTTISVPHFKLFGGTLLVSYSMMALLGGVPKWTTIRNRVLDGFIGMLGGICGGLASVSGPIMTVWCGLRGWTKDEQRGTYQPYNFAMHVFAITAFGVAGLLTLELFYLTLLSLPVTIIGMWLGRRLYDRIDEKGFQKIIFVLLTVSGVTLIWNGLAGTLTGN